ncbi:hypothetical protein DOY81_015357, partial [Sarcophaga bullata]
NIPDFSDIILDVKNEKMSVDEQLKKPLDLLNGEINLKDPKLNAISTSIKDEDLDLNFEHTTAITTASNLVRTATEDFNGNGLSVIEQFQLNHNMQISSDNIELAKDIENLNNLESHVFETAPNNLDQQKSLLKSLCTTLEDNQQQTNNNNNNTDVVPTLSYESWLDHVIEILNDSITVQDSNSIRNTFHVPEAIFNHFSKTFTINNKRRLPNTTTVIKSGKYKDHIKYIWYFNQVTTVQRIFSSKNFKIELERSFQRLSDNNFVVYKPEIITLTENNNYRPIYPKLQLYKVLVQFSNAQDLFLNNPV